MTTPPTTVDRWALAGVVLLAGCGQPYSNQPLRDDVAQDVELAGAIPESDAFALTAPTEEDAAHPRRSCAGAGASKAACRSFKFAAGISRLTRELMRPAKQLASVPPSERSPGRRVWGPTQAPDGHWRRVVANKLEESGGAWAVEVSEARTGPWRALVSGAPGSITYDGDAARIGGKDHAGVLHMEFEGQGCERSLSLQLSGFKRGDREDEEGASEGQFRFRRSCDGAGRMDWGFLADHPRRDCQIANALVVRWNAEGAGRADSKFFGAECWDSDFQVVASDQCAFAESVEPEGVTVPSGTCGASLPD